MAKQDFLEFRPIKKLTSGIGKDIKEYIGKDKACIIGVGDDGFFYAIGLYHWLKKAGKNVTLTFMDDEGKGLEKNKMFKRKVVMVDNDIVTGKYYKKAIEIMRGKKEELKLTDIKYAVLTDRVGLADFTVEDYLTFVPWSIQKIDGLDLKIIQNLSKDGRKSFIEIAKETKLSPVAIKNRIEKLIKEGVLNIQGGLSLEKFYSVSAQIEIEADKKTTSDLIEKFIKSPLVYHLVKTSGRYNLMVGVAAPNLQSIESFIEREIRGKTGVNNIEVNFGELPLVPKSWKPFLS